MFGNTPFELLNHRPVVGQPLVVEDLVDTGEERRPITDIGPPDMHGLGKCRRGAIDRKVCG